jgi:hypothetical protein
MAVADWLRAEIGYTASLARYDTKSTGINAGEIFVTTRRGDWNERSGDSFAY